MAYFITSECKDILVNDEHKFFIKKLCNSLKISKLLVEIKCFEMKCDIMQFIYNDIVVQLIKINIQDYNFYDNYYLKFTLDNITIFVIPDFLTGTPNMISTCFASVDAFYILKNKHNINNCNLNNDEYIMKPFIANDYFITYGLYEISYKCINDENNYDNNEFSIDVDGMEIETILNNDIVFKKYNYSN